MHQAPVLALRHWASVDLAALSSALRLGAVPQRCRAYTPAVTAGFIDETGRPVDTEALSAALDAEISARLDQEAQE